MTSVSTMEDGHFSSLFKELDKDRNGEKLYCNVTISVNNGKLFHAHRCVLGTFCEYFSTLFRSDFKDKYSEIIKLSGPIDEEISSDTFRLILDFCYSKKSGLTPQNVFEILSGAEFLQCHRLKAECGEFLTTLITPENWLQIYRIGVKLNHEPLLIRCMDNFLQIESKIDITKFNFDEFHAVVKYGSLKFSGTKIFGTIMKWTDKCQQDIKQVYFDKTAHFINFKDMSLAFLANNVLNNKLCMNSVTALQCLVVTQHSAIETLTGGFIVLGGASLKAQVSVRNWYSGFRHTWNSLPKPCYQSAVTSSDSHIFVAGGHDNEGNIQVYNRNDDDWFLSENVIKRPRVDTSICVVDDRLYMFGGWMSNGTTLTSVEAFDIKGDGCISNDDHVIPDLNVARYAQGYVTKDKVVYLLGGYGRNKNVLSSCETVNVSTGVRGDIAPMQTSRYRFPAVIYDDKILVFGGHSKNGLLQSVESYSFSTSQWCSMPEMSLSVNRAKHCACVFKGKLYIMGGSGSNGGDLDTIEVYNSASSEWEVVEHLLMPRVSACVIVL